MTKMLWVRNWAKWQTYKRASPPWIKLHRCVLRDHEFVSLTSEQRGELMCIWLLAADNCGGIPNDAELVQKLCQLSTKPNLTIYQALGFLTKTRHPRDRDRDRGRDRGREDLSPSEEVVIEGPWPAREVFG